MKSHKGEYGYIRKEKKIRLLRTAAMFAVDFAIFFLGLYLNKGDRRNIYSIIAAVGCIPAAMSAVSLIMMLMRRPADRNLVEEIRAHAQNLKVLYELYLTTQEKNLFLDAAVISGGYIIAYSSEQKPQQVLSFMESHIRKAMRQEGLAATVKIFGNRKNFLERVDQLCAREKGEDTEKNEMMAAVLCQIAL